MYDELKKILTQSNNIVFFGGAGVSTEGNIPDFRSQSGIYSRKAYPYRAEAMIGSEFFHKHPEQFYDFYFHEMVYERAQPNDAHLALTRLKEMGRLKAVITQDIDGLHQRTGSHKILELRGGIHRSRCQRCHTRYDLQEVLKQRKQVPRCPSCSGILKPEVVLYGEGLDMQVMEEATLFLSQADMFIVGGTSLVVYPVAGLLQYLRGSKLILIDKEETMMDHRADLVIHDAIGKVIKETVLVQNKEIRRAALAISYRILSK